MKNDLKDDIKKHLQIEDKNLSDNCLDEFDIINQSDLSDLENKDLYQDNDESGQE